MSGTRLSLFVLVFHPLLTGNGVTPYPRIHQLIGCQLLIHQGSSIDTVVDILLQIAIEKLTLIAIQKRINQTTRMKG